MRANATQTRVWIASPARSRRVRDVFGARRARNNRELESHCAKCAIIIFLIAARTCTCARPLVVLHFYYNTYYGTEKESCQLYMCERVYEKSLTLDQCAHSAWKFQYFVYSRAVRCDIIIETFTMRILSVAANALFPWVRERCWERQSCEEKSLGVVMKCWVHSAGRAMGDFNGEIHHTRERKRRGGGNLNDKCVLFGRIWLNKERIKSAKWN